MRDHEGEDEHEGEDHHDEHEGFELEPFTFSDQSVSGVVTIGRELTDSLSASLNMGLVTRTPSAMELFMNGEHLAVARYEVGDANLDAEETQNLDFNLRYDDQTWFANASIFRNTLITTSICAMRQKKSMRSMKKVVKSTVRSTMITVI